MALDGAAWGKQASDQLSWHWDNHIRPHLDGLTDAEYFWEPVAGCWSVRPEGESNAPLAIGAGPLRLDFAFPEPVPAPLTTIAWRLGHVLVGCFGMRNAAHFGGPPVDYQTAVWPAGAAAALAELDAAYGCWAGGVAAFTAEDWARPVGPAEGVWSDTPYAGLVMHINREVIHHMAEVLLLRDLYRNRA